MKKEDCVVGKSYKLLRATFDDIGGTFDHFDNNVPAGQIITIVDNDRKDDDHTVWVCTRGDYEDGLSYMDDVVFDIDPAILASIELENQLEETTPVDLLTKNIEVITAFANGKSIMHKGSRDWFHVGRDDSIDLREEYKIADEEECHPQRAAILRWLELSKANRQGELYYSEDDNEFHCDEYSISFEDGKVFYEKVVIS